MTPVRGILHIGANAGAEANIYSICVGANVLFIECDPGVAELCMINAAKYGQRCVNLCLSNESATRKFNIADNLGMSSSLLDFGDHKHLYPDVMMAASLPVVTQRYDDWHRGIPRGLLPEMNLLTVDVQGMEYEVLQVSYGCLTTS